MRKALAIYHVAFEDLGSLGAVLIRNGFAITMADACKTDWADIDADSYDAVIVLGGPIGVYEQTSYPFLLNEIQLISRGASRHGDVPAPDALSSSAHYSRY